MPSLKIHLLLSDIYEDEEGELVANVMAEDEDGQYGGATIYVPNEEEADKMRWHFLTKIEPFEIDIGQMG